MVTGRARERRLSRLFHPHARGELFSFTAGANSNFILPRMELQNHLFVLVVNILGSYMARQSATYDDASNLFV